MKISIRAAVVMIVFCGCLRAQEQGNSTIIGFPEHGIFSGNAFDSVQTNNGNLHIEIPLQSAKGRHLDSAFKLVYDNKGWTVDLVCESTFCQSFIVPSGNMQWNLAGVYYTLDVTPHVFACGISSGSMENFDLTEPDGTTHHFVPDANLVACLPDSRATKFYASDGSGWVIDISSGTSVVISPSGATITSLQSVVDANGNTISQSFDNTLNANIDTDTLGRTTRIPSIGVDNSISYVDSDGVSRTISFFYTDVVVHHDEFCAKTTLPETCFPFDGTFRMLSRVAFPDASEYHINYAPAQDQLGEPVSATLPTGAQ